MSKPARARTLPRGAAVVGFVLGLVLAGCSLTPPEQEPSGGQGTGVAESDVDVATPQLRRLREQAGVEACAPGTATPVDGGLPSVTLPCLGGGKDVDLATLRGPLVLNLWASWCAPCRKELPILNSFAERYDGRVDVLGVDFSDPQPASALELVDETGATFPHLADPGQQLNGRIPPQHANLQGLPATVFVNRTGQVTFLHFGEVTSEDELVGLAEKHLGVSLD